MTDFLPTSVMHRKPHAPEHMVRIYDLYEVHVVCTECGMHDWGDWGADESQYTVANFRVKYGDRVLSVETFGSAEDELWECAKHPETAYDLLALTPSRPDGTRGHLMGPDIDGGVIGTCPGPVNGPVKGF